MEKLFKLRVFGSEIYTVKAIHVTYGQRVYKGQKMATITSSDVSIDVIAQADVIITEILVHVGDHVKSSNTLFKVYDETSELEYVERKAVGY
jgi:biotin carboxyl carrier protein